MVCLRKKRKRKKERKREAWRVTSGGEGAILSPGRNNEDLPVGGRACSQYREKGIVMELAGIFLN